MSETSDKQVAANRQNAKLGGVKTEEGKEVSKMNAQKHSILTKAMADDEGKQAAEIQKQLRADYKPVGWMEEAMIERIAVCYVRLQRSAKAEAEQLMKIRNPRKVEITGGLQLETFGERTEVIEEGYSPKVTDEHIELLEKTYLRYDTAIERSLYRALHELQRLQAARNGEKPPAPAVLDVEVNQDS